MAGSASVELAEFAAKLYLDSLETVRVRDARASCVSEIEAEIEPLDRLYCASAADRDAHTALCPVVSELRCGVLRLRAEHLEREERFAQAGAAYVGIARDHPACGRRDEMLWNAAIDYERARLLGRAIQVRQALIRSFPTSDLARRATCLVGANYHALAIYSQAADCYERFAREHPTSDESTCTEAERAAGTCAIAYVALENAVFFLLVLGEEDQALADAALYERSYRRSRASETSQVIFSLGSSYERRADWSHVTSPYQAFLRDYARMARPHEAIRAHVELGRAAIELGRPDQAHPHFEAAVRAYHHGAEAAIHAAAPTPADEALWTARARDATSEALYELADERFAEMVAEGRLRRPFPDEPTHPNEAYAAPLANDEKSPT